MNKFVLNILFFENKCSYIRNTITQQGNNILNKMKTNIDKIKIQLDGLVEKLSGQDRMAAAMEFNCHIETINRYMRGEVRKEAFGLQLLGFFKTRINEREKALVQ